MFDTWWERYYTWDWPFLFLQSDRTDSTWRRRLRRLRIRDRERCWSNKNWRPKHKSWETRIGRNLQSSDLFCIWARWSTWRTSRPSPSCWSRSLGRRRTWLLCRSARWCRLPSASKAAAEERRESRSTPKRRPPTGSKQLFCLRFLTFSDLSSSQTLLDTFCLCGWNREASNIDWWDRP